MVGRTREVECLRNACTKREAQLVAVYGRRRVGKTYLVRETFGDKFAFSHTGLGRSDMAGQLIKFQESLERYGSPHADPAKDWIEAFRRLENVIARSRMRKKVVFIDELPWMDTHKSGFLSAFEGFWNGWGAARKDLALIICGSATSWIVSKIFKNRGGLYNRITESIYLQPFCLAECRQLCQGLGLSYSDIDLAELYMIFGGIPYYWSLLERGKSVAQNVDALLFRRGGKLAREFDELYASLFREGGGHLPCVRALLSRQCGMTAREILDKAKIGVGGAQMKCLEELDQCGFIRKFTALGKKKRDALYQLVDNFTLFHLKFLDGESNPDEHFWSHATTMPAVVAWRGLAFERVCLQHVSQIKRALGVSGVLTRVFSWRHVPTEMHPDGAQVDLVIERADRIVNLCEMKFTQKPYVVTKGYDEKLRFRAALFSEVTKMRLSPHITMITPYGVSRSSYLSAFQSEVTLRDLFKEK